jgi:antitoxin VapB
MALNIKDDETERLAKEIAALTGESKTGAIRTALRERRERLALQRTAGDRERALRALLVEEVWPLLSTSMIGHAPSAEEQDAILGYGPEGA